MDTVYIIGSPASGKTTAQKWIISNWRHIENRKKPIAHRIYRDIKQEGYQIVLGKDSPVFGGTDTLAFNALAHMPDIYKKWADKGQFSLVFAEGDRFANKKFFDIAKQHGNLYVINLVIDEKHRANRSKSRAIKNDLTEQNLAWAKGRVTKNKNLAKAVQAINIDCGYYDDNFYMGKTVQDVADEIKKVIYDRINK